MRRVWCYGGLVVALGVIWFTRVYWLAAYAQFNYYLELGRADRPREYLHQLQGHPEFILLPLRERLLEHGAWATPATAELIERLRPLYPHERDTLDYYQPVGCSGIMIPRARVRFSNG